MKTLDKVIEYFNNQCQMRHVYLTEDADARFAEALHYLKEYKRLQIAFLKALADLEDNPPMTWDALKQMEGKPVWVEVLDDNRDHYKWRGDGWYIVKDFTQGYYGRYCHLEPSWRTWTESTYGDLWQAYRKERR